MRIVKPYARLMHHVLTPNSAQGIPVDPEDGVSALQRIEWCARISHRAEDSQTFESFSRFLKSVVIDHGDWSVIEHVSVSVDCLTDRGITHEIVRHRLFSYTQESTRFVNYAKEKDGKPKNPACFIYPIPDVWCLYCDRGNEPSDWLAVNNSYVHSFRCEAIVCAYDPMWLKLIERSEATYRTLIQKGWRPQEARSVFPNALASRIIITGNLRNWRHFFIMRTTQEAHPQMRQITIPLLAEFKQTYPILFDDIEPNQKQSNNLRLPR